MPRRLAPGGLVYHAMNRAVEGVRLFEDRGDYAAFEAVLAEAHDRVALRVLAYTIMPNHWHFVVWPETSEQLSAFFYWLSMTHTRRWRVFRDAVGRGHLYQGRFKSIPVATDGHVLNLCRYVERNPLAADLVERAVDWPWGSLARRERNDHVDRAPLEEWPVPRRDDWARWVDTPLHEKELESIRSAIRRGVPLGDPDWQKEIAAKTGLAHRLRRPGRPRKTQIL